MKNWKLFLAFFLTFLAACGSSSTPTETKAELPLEILPAESQFIDSAEIEQPELSSGVLISVLSQGGLCEYGLCSQEVIIYKDNTYKILEGNGEPNEGRIAAEIVEELNELIAATDFDVMRSVPFTNECPTAFNGREYIYTFYTSAGDETVSSCEFALDESSPLFILIFTLLADL